MDFDVSLRVYNLKQCLFYIFNVEWSNIIRFYIHKIYKAA